MNRTELDTDEMYGLKAIGPFGGSMISTRVKWIWAGWGFAVNSGGHSGIESAPRVFYTDTWRQDHDG